MKNEGDHFEQEYGGHFKLKLGGKYDWNLHFIKKINIIAILKQNRLILFKK